jgi:hypothetical protein
MNVAPVAILRKWTPANGGGLAFDAVFQETHDAELEVTDNPVETGVIVSDHAYMKPLKITISAGVSDSPLHTPAGGDPFGAGLAPSRSRQAFQMLLDLQKSAEPFSVQTGLKLYTNMVCTRISTSQDKDTGNVLVFEAQLREVILSQTQLVNTPTRKAGPTQRQASAKKQKGEQQGQQVTEPTMRQQLVNQVKGWFGMGK